jgi:hypothetical protein
MDIRTYEWFYYLEAYQAKPPLDIPISIDNDNEVCDDGQ